MGNEQEPDFYDILGVDRSAGPEEITRAYRKAMRAVHPDASGTSGLFRLVKAAYDTLGDQGARASYDAGRRTAPPPEPPARTPPPSAQPPRSTRESPRTERPVPPVRTASHPRVRPRFGAHWTQVAVVVAWTAGFAAVVYGLWPGGVPLGLSLLLVLPVIGAPLIAAQPASRSRTWSWPVCAVLFGGGAVLAVAAGGLWPLAGALAGLAVGGGGLALVPILVRNGCELDRVVGRDCLTYEIFGTAGAGLTEPGAREVARISGARLERLATAPAVRMIHGLTAPDGSGYVAHALLRDDRLALVTAGETVGDGIGAAVRAFRTVLPSDIRVRGFAVRQAGARPSASGHLFTGTVSEVHAELGTWLEAAAPVIRRRVLATLLGHAAG